MPTFPEPTARLMATPRHLANAPITEAIIDFRVKAAPDLALDRLRAAHETIAQDFPRVEERRHARFAFEMGKAMSAEDLGTQGYFYYSNDNRTVAQFRVDGFTFNRLAPYPSWEELLPLIQRLWVAYLDAAKPQALIRIGVRYLNQIPLPADMTDMERYLNAPPVVPAEMPQHVSDFLTRVSIEDTDEHLTVHLGQKLQVDADRRVALLVDVDVVENTERSCDAPDVVATLERMRTMKNRAFFSLLTDELVRTME